MIFQGVCQNNFKKVMKNKNAKIHYRKLNAEKMNRNKLMKIVFNVKLKKKKRK